jgi:hypothetical protein
VYPDGGVLVPDATNAAQLVALVVAVTVNDTYAFNVTSICSTPMLYWFVVALP